MHAIPIVLYMAVLANEDIQSYNTLVLFGFPSARPITLEMCNTLDFFLN
jgi:hypothetical protein